MVDIEQKPRVISKPRKPLLILLAAALGLGGLGFTYPIVPTGHDKKDSNELQVQLNAAYWRFQDLPEEVKKSLLGNLDKYVKKETQLGRTAQRLCDIAKSMEFQIIEDPSLDAGIVVYDFYRREIRYREEKANSQMRLYLSGISPFFKLAQKCINAIQDRYGKWHDFRLSLKDFASKSNTPLTGFNIPLEGYVRIVEKFLKKSQLTPEQAKAEFMRLWSEYQSSSQQRNLIQVVNASLTFAHYAQPKQLYEAMEEYPYQQRVLRGTNQEDFGPIFFGTRNVLALLGPVRAPEFVGRNGESFSDFISAVYPLIIRYHTGHVESVANSMQRRIIADMQRISQQALGQLYLVK